MRLAVLLFLLAGCGKEVNPDYVSAHPDAASDAARFDAPGCPSGYSGGYRTVDSAVAWQDAEADCADDGPTTHLAVISSQAELTALAQYVDRDRYVGHTDQVNDGTWLAVTDEPTTLAGIGELAQPPWGAGEPNEGSSGNVAVLAMSDALLHDRNGSEVQAYICECDAYAEDRSHF